MVGSPKSYEEQEAEVYQLLEQNVPGITSLEPSIMAESAPLEPLEEGVMAKKAVLDNRIPVENHLLEQSFDKRLTEDEINLLAEENGRRGVTELFTADGIALKTELNSVETVRFSQLLFMANRYEIAGIDQFVNNLLQLKVSLARKGRSEFIQGLHAEERRMMGQDMSPIQALMSKLGGG